MIFQGAAAANILVARNTWKILNATTLLSNQTSTLAIVIERAFLIIYPLAIMLFTIKFRYVEIWYIFAGMFNV